MAYEREDFARLLRDPATPGAFRITMWGYLFFLPPISTYFDALAWLVLLLTARRMGASWPGRRALRSIAVLGLVIASVRVTVLICRAVSAPSLYVILSTASLGLAAMFLWHVCTLVTSLAHQAGKRALSAQAMQCRWLYVLYAILPSVAFAAGASMNNQLGKLVVFAAYMIASVIITTLVLAFLANVAKVCRVAAADAALGPSA